MIAEAGDNGIPNPNGGMPGQLQGEVGVLDFEQDIVDRGPVMEGAEGEGSDDEANIEVCEGSISVVIFLRLVPALHYSRSQ